MPSVAPIVVAQTGQFHLTDYYYARSSVLGLPYIPGASLPNGTRWWVTVAGTLAGEYLPLNVPPMNPWKLQASIIQGYPAQKTYGTVQLRSNLHGFEPYRAGQISTSFILDSDGTDLEFLFYTVDGGFDAWLTGFKIVAYPMADMVAGIDYFYEANAGDGTDSGAIRLQTASSTFAPMLSKTYNIQVPGQYLILANCGMNCIQGQAAKVRLMESGAQLGVDWKKKMYAQAPSDDRVMAPFMEVRTLAPAPGNITYALEGASESGGGDKKFYQPRITLIRLDYFAAVSLQTSIGGTIPEVYPTWRVARQTILSPTLLDDYALVLSNTTQYPGVQGFVANRIRNITAGTFTDEGQAQANHFDTNVDRLNIQTVGCQLATGPTTYLLEACGEIGDTTMTHGTLVAIQLTPATAGNPPVSITVTETIDISDSYTGLNAVITRSDVLDIVESSSMTVTGGPVSIPNMHPRLFSAADIAYWQAHTGSAFFTDMIAHLGASDYALWNYAVAWRATGNATYLNWIKAHLDQICYYHLSGWESNGLTVNRWVKSASIIYDLCYDDLTAAEKLKLQDFILGSVYAVARANPHPMYEDFNLAYLTDWSRNDPKNNYFASVHLAAVYCAVTLYHDCFGPTLPNPTFSWPPGTGQNTRAWIIPLYKPAHLSHGTGSPPGEWEGPSQPPYFTDGVEYVKARFEQLIMPWWDRKSSGGLTGGGWHEGSWYRPMWAMYDGLKLMQDIAGYSPPIQNIDFRDLAYYNFHAVMPGSTRAPELGSSGSADVRKSVGGNDRVLMLYLARTYRNEPLGQYIQWWLQNVVTSTGAGADQWYGYDFALYDANITPIDFRPIISKSFYSPSNGLVFSRTGWTTSDTCCMLHSQDRIELHEHAEQNGIQIVNGRGGSGDSQWMVGPRCAYTSSGDNQDESDKTKNHSCYEIAGVWQRPSNTNQVPYPGDNLPTGNIDLYSPFNGVSTYARANASDAYRLGAGTTITPDPQGKVCDVYLTDWVHLPGPNLNVVYDRIRLLATTPGGTSVPQTCKSYLHVTSLTTPTNSGAGGVTTIQANTARTFKKTIFPAAQAVTLTNESAEVSGTTTNCYEELSDLAVVSNFVRHLRVFDVTDTSQATMNPTAAITSSDYFEGVSVDDGGIRYHFLFTLSQTGAAPAGDFYYDVVKLSANDQHVVMGLTPNFTGYVVTESAQGGGVYRYSFQRTGAGLAADIGGKLEFTPASLVAGPTVTISETAIALTDSLLMIESLEITETAVALSDSLLMLDSVVLTDSAVTLSDVVEFGIEANVEVTETAITLDDNLTISDIFAILETGIALADIVEPVGIVPITETDVTLSESLFVSEVIAPLSSTVTISADTVSVTVIPPPVTPPAPGTAGGAIDTRVDFEGDFDTRVDL